MTIELEEKDLQYLHNTSMRSFIKEQPRRFLPFYQNEKELLTKMAQQEDMYLYWCDTFLDMKALDQLLMKLGYLHLCVCDEASIDGNISSYVVLTNKGFDF